MMSHDGNTADDRSDWIMPGALLLVGLPFVAMAIYMAGEELLFRLQSTATQGMVVERKGRVPSLIVEYADTTGSKHRIETFGSDFYDDVPVGQTVKVYMDAAQPQKARPEWFTAAWMLPLISGVFGSFFAIPGLVFAQGALRAPLRARRLARNGQRLQALVVEIRPTLSLEGFRQRLRLQGNAQLNLHRHADRWRMVANGREYDPFSVEARRDWGVRYTLVAEWTDARTGKTHRCESAALDLDPETYRQFPSVNVQVDPNDPDNCQLVVDASVIA